MINVDFNILNTSDPNTLSIVDNSNWENIENKPSIVEIFLPGCKNPVVHYFQKNSINTFNSLNLDINCGCDEETVPLEDGVYSITVKGSPDSYNKTKKVLRTVNAELKLDLLYINSNLLCNTPKKGDLDRLFKIKALIGGAKANIRYGNDCAAQELFFKAQEMIEETKTNCES